MAAWKCVSKPCSKRTNADLKAYFDKVYKNHMGDLPENIPSTTWKPGKRGKLYKSPKGEKLPKRKKFQTAGTINWATKWITRTPMPGNGPTMPGGTLGSSTTTESLDDSEEEEDNEVSPGETSSIKPNDNCRDGEDILFGFNKRPKIEYSEVEEGENPSEDSVESDGDATMKPADESDDSVISSTDSSDDSSETSEGPGDMCYRRGNNDILYKVNERPQLSDDEEEKN